MIHKGGADYDLVQNQNENDDIMVSTRVRFARNLGEYPFPNAMKREDMDAAKKKIFDALDAERDIFPGGIPQD